MMRNCHHPFTRLVIFAKVVISDSEPKRGQSQGNHFAVLAQTSGGKKEFLTHAYEVYTISQKMEFDFAYKNCDFAHELH